MNKRKLGSFALVASFFALCFSAEAQQPTKIPRVGYLVANFPSTNPARNEAFRQALRELGYVEGKNILIEPRYTEGKLDRLPALAAELVRLKVDVIVTGGAGATRPAKEATVTIPIVMTNDNDPVGNGVFRLTTEVLCFWTCPIDVQILSKMKKGNQPPSWAS